MLGFSLVVNPSTGILGLDDRKEILDLFSGLKELAESAFPKKCNSCGRTYKNAEEFFAATHDVKQQASGLKAAEYDDGRVIVESFRNCACGSTLLVYFNDRRDMSPRGLQRRKLFGELLDQLVNSGYERNVARDELLNVLYGRESTLVKRNK